MQRCIETLLDQYTVKGKAHKASVNSFVAYLMAETEVGLACFEGIFRYLVINNQ
jgi:hypothetical protein